MSADCHFEGWAYRRTLSVNPEMVSAAEDLVDFPSTIELQNPELSKARLDGADFLFTSIDGVKLSHEIRKWNPVEGRLVVVVRIPKLSPRTMIFLWYGNPNAQDQQDVEGVWKNKYTYSKKLSDEEPLRQTSGSLGGTISRATFLEQQIQMLEDLFGADWFAAPSPKRRCHPAYQQWKFYNNMRTSAGRLSWRNQGELNTSAANLVRALRDNASWVQCTQGDIGVFRFGRLIDYGDAEVVRRVKAVIQDSHQYEDLMAELICASWHLSQGHSVKPSESPGSADFIIGVPGWNLPIIADCKRLSNGATARTLKSHVEKANQQIKTVGSHAYGLVLLNVTDWLPNTMQLDDKIPDVVTKLQEEVAQLLSRFYTAISAAVLSWDEIVILGPKPNSPLFVMAVLRTKSVVVNHRAPLRPLPMDTDAIKMGANIEFHIRG